MLDERRRAIIKRQSKARKAHFRRVSIRQCAPENKAVYNQLLLGLERAGNECSNLVEHGAELSMWGDALGAAVAALFQSKQDAEEIAQEEKDKAAEG